MPIAKVGRLPLHEAIRDPGFTPSVRDLAALVEMLAHKESSRDAERALVRIGPAAAAGLLDRFLATTGVDQALMVRALGRFATEPAVRNALVDVLSSPDSLTRRRAATALGHGRGQDIERALLDAWSRDNDPIVHRRVAESLGKVGTSASIDALREATRSSDVELARIAQRALTMVVRTASRPDRGVIDPTRSPPRPVRIQFSVRRGLEEILVDELRAIPELGGARSLAPEQPGQVVAELSGPLDHVFAARTMLSFSFPLPPESLRERESTADALGRALSGPVALNVLATWTSGAVRYRLRWADGSHRRAATWEAARSVGRATPDFVNDPTASLWEFRVLESPGLVEIALSPRALDDPRFSWRRADVPAASHPTIAAALARIAGVRDDDVVWDPFVGSAGELIERARLGPVRALLGGDTEARALVASRQNLEAAGVQAQLQQIDALDARPSGVTLIITNPPMGRRASRAPGLAEVLDGFLAHAAGILVPGGRLVWIAPWPVRSRAVGARCGLKLDWARDVDMGGFDAQIQRFTK